MNSHNHDLIYDDAFLVAHLFFPLAGLRERKNQTLQSKSIVSYKSELHCISTV
jgi:hypothetical protein